jgi:endonuclease G
MVELRRNHESQSGGFMVRMMLIALFLFGVAWWWGSQEWPQTKAVPVQGAIAAQLEYPLDERVDQIVEHKHYTLGYDEDAEQASWVAYRLTREHLARDRVPRTDYFNEDPEVFTKSSHHRDYIRSGYTRGHLVPAADRAYSTEAMEETFFMSNISPQLRAFNGGIWRELEEHTRDWAWARGEIIVFSGPVLKGATKHIGKTSKVLVPEYFYKVIFDPKVNEVVAFLLPNVMSSRPVVDYLVSVDDVEEATGIDFLKDMVSEQKEKEIEARADMSTWPVDERKFKWRVEEWNKR